MELAKFLALKKRVEELEKTAGRLEGGLDQIRQRLRDEYSCDSVKQAKESLAKLEAEEKQLNEELGSAIAKFQQEWKDVLEKVDDR